MKLTRKPRASSRVLTAATADVCPHCGEGVEMVTIMGIARIRCDPEMPLEFADGTYHFVRMMHLCRDRGARRRAIRDIIGQIPRG